MSHFTIEEMFKVSQGNNSGWGIEGYDVPKKHFDYYKTKYKKDIEALKPGKYLVNNKKITKKGHYLDFQYKSQRVTKPQEKAKYYPAPNRYFPTKTYKEIIKAQTARKQKPCDMKAIRGGLLYQIMFDAKKPSRMVPGPGKYFKKTKAEAEAELKKIKASNKTSKAMRDNFLMEFEHLSSLTPGPGQYFPRKHYPHVSMKPVKQQYGATKPDDWKKKHKVGDKVKRLKAVPKDQLRHPKQSKFETFETIQMRVDAKQQSGVKHWGTSKRFSYDRAPGEKPGKPGKKEPKPKGAVPGPGKYNITSNWLMKDKSRLKSQDILKKVSSGGYTSIYY